jgi:signal peptidase I
MRRAAFRVALAIAGVLVLGLVALVGLLATGTLKAYAIPNSAMEPTLHCGRPALGCEAARKDRVLALMRFVSYERGDLVVLRASPRAEGACGVGGTFVKRVIGLPGEKVETRLIEGAAHVFIDGRRLAEPYVEIERRTGGEREWIHVPGDHVFVLGDNRAQSCDSSVFGPVREDDVIGKLVATYWPPDRISFR